MPLFIWSALLLHHVVSEKSLLPGNLSYSHLLLPGHLSLEEQYILRVGHERGFIGRNTLPVILPPTDFQRRLSRIYRYKLGDAPCAKTLDPSADFTPSTFYRHYMEKTQTVKTYENASKTAAESILPFVASVSQSHLQFLTYFCLRRYYFTNATQLEMGVRSALPDYYRFCPSACGNRESSGMSEAKRIKLHRYNDPCSYPPTYSPYASRACVVPKISSFTHQESFQCRCLPGARWLPQSKICSFPFDPVLLDCDPLGTSHIGPMEVDAAVDAVGAALGVSHQVFRCICKPQYYGTRCDKLKDPCLMSIGDALPGNLACAVQRGNLCIPDMETSRYICKCTNQYSRMPKTALPRGRLPDNCLREVDPCSLKACMHGICVLSDIGITLEVKGKQQREPFTWLGRAPAFVARCLCNEGWTGDTCGHPLVLNGWTPWSPWSQCEPACQTSIRELPPTAVREMVPVGQSTPRWGVRQRTRYRDCIGQASDCRQEILEHSADMGLTIEDGESWRHYERRACRPRPCDRHLYLAMGKRAVRRSRMQKQVRDTLKQAYTVHLWTVLAFTFLFAIFAFFAAFAVKIQMERAYEEPYTENRCDQRYL